MGFEHAVSCPRTDLFVEPSTKNEHPLQTSDITCNSIIFEPLQSLLRTCFIRLVELKKEKEKKGVSKRKRRAMKWVRVQRRQFSNPTAERQQACNLSKFNPQSKRICPHSKKGERNNTSSKVPKVVTFSTTSQIQLFLHSTQDKNCWVVAYNNIKTRRTRISSSFKCKTRN